MANKDPVRRKRGRVAHKHAKTSQEILQAAREVLQESGLEAVTLASVAARLQLTKQALYHYFPSKEALVRSLTLELIDEEIEAIIKAVEETAEEANVLGVMIRAFYDHYIHHLDAFRAVYCQSQLRASRAITLDPDTLRNEINPRTRHLFDVLEARLSSTSMTVVERKEKRRLAFTAWLAALGMITMLGVADSANDPLKHSDEDLLNMLSTVFGSALASGKSPAT